MVELKDQSSSYEPAESVQAGKGFEVFRAREKSTGAACLYHRINVEKGAKETEIQSAVAVLRRYGQLRYARTPRLADGWFAEGHLVAVEYRLDARPLHEQTNNPFHMGGRRAHDIIEATLSLVCSLHFLGIVHGNICPSSFGVGPLGKVYLVDSGLDRSLVNAFNKSNDDMFMLSTNLLGQDVAQWAYSMLTLMIGGPVIEQQVDDKWDEIHFQRVKERISRLFPRQELLDYFMDCLSGFGVNDPKFDSATDAMKKWYDKQLWRLFE
jgi:serine/threonine protein kinase